MKTAVIYARYSSDAQTEQSIEGQLRVCNDFAEKNNYLVVDTYIDRALTGTNDNRNEFQKMLKDSAKQVWDVVIVYKLDRFSRNKYESVIHKKTLKDNGVRIVSAMENIPDTPEGTLMETLLEGFNQYFSEELAQKVKRGMNESRQKGQFTGGSILYGYRVEKKKVYIEEEQANIVREIYEKYASGVFVKDIIKDLTDRGIYHRGKPFARTTLYNMLANEKYAGILRYGEEIFTNIYPRIVPEHVYNIVRQKVEENHFGKHDSTVQYLLKNKIVCGYCGKTISSESGTAKNGTVKRYYKCTGRKTCANDCAKSTMRKDTLEKLVIDTTFKMFENKELVSEVADKIIELHKKRMADQSLLIMLTKEKNDTQKAIDNLIACMEQGIITNSTKKRISELEHKLEDLEEKILRERSKEKIQTSKEDIIKFIRTTLKKEPKQILKLLIDKIILFDDKIEIYYNYVEPKRISPDDDHQDFLFYTDTFETTIDECKFNTPPIKISMQIKAHI